MDRYLILARFVHFTATALLFGGAVFVLYGQGALFQGCRLRTWLIACTAATILSALLWWDAMAVSMSGEWVAALDAGTLAKVLLTTAFGRVWLVRMVLATVLLVVLLRWKALDSPAKCWMSVLCAGAVTAALGGTGHAIMLSGAAGFLLMGTQALHALAASAWVGGLVPLGVSLSAARRGEGTAGELPSLLRRFSAMGIVAVGVLVVSGAIGAFLVMPGFVALLTAAYGQILSLKTLLFLMMLWFAVDNRWHLAPLVASNGMAVSALISNIAFEIVLGVAVLAMAAILGTLNPHDMPNLFQNGSGTDGGPGIASEVDRTVKVEARDIGFDAKEIEVRAGETIRFTIANTGKLRHEFVVASHGEHVEHRAMMQAMPNMEMGAEPNAVTVDPGETKELIWKFGKDMNVEFACDIPGHAEAGMAGNFQVDQ